MKKPDVSEEAQWDILDYLFKVYPRRLTNTEFRKRFGDPEDAALIANVRQLITYGFVGRHAAIKTMHKETISPSELRLTPVGVNLMQNAQLED